MSLEARLKNQIKATGPISVADYMAQVLYDPEGGYYATKVPIGSKGDYITAPEMTQVFGEVIALWLIDVWQKAGCPKPFHLVEIGPGRGTMMADILRTLKALKIPLHELTVHLIEVSPLLKELQKTTLSSYSASICWHEDLTTLPQDQGYCLMIANEFWDALPIQQQVKVNDKWVERRIALEEDTLIFLPNEPTVKETCPAMPGLVDQISYHLKTNGGAALFIDYGYDQQDAIGDTLQALENHRKQSPLINPGFADLTHHVDFHRLKLLFAEKEMKVHGPIFQGDFLKSLGFDQRTEALCEHANPTQSSSLRTAAVRLTHPNQMGTLFKVLCVRDCISTSPKRA